MNKRQRKERDRKNRIDTSVANTICNDTKPEIDTPLETTTETIEPNNENDFKPVSVTENTTANKPETENKTGESDKNHNLEHQESKLDDTIETKSPDSIENKIPETLPSSDTQTDDIAEIDIKNQDYNKTSNDKTTDSTHENDESQQEPIESEPDNNDDPNANPATEQNNTQAIPTQHNLPDIDWDKINNDEKTQLRKLNNLSMDTEPDDENEEPEPQNQSTLFQKLYVGIGLTTVIIALIIMIS